MKKRSKPQPLQVGSAQVPSLASPLSRHNNPTGLTAKLPNAGALLHSSTSNTHAGGASASTSGQRKSTPMQTTVLIVVNVLPLVFERNVADDGWQVEWSSSATSMFYRNLVSDAGKYTPLFIGCPEVFISKSEEDAVEKQLRKFHCVPVFLDPAVAHRYFQGFCKGVLWPVFHNVVDVYNSAKLTLDEYQGDNESKAHEDSNSSEPTNHKKMERRNSFGSNCWRDPASWNPAAQDKCWSDYCSVNRTFAKRIIESYHDGNLIWIHDFHFLMLPSYLLRKVRTALVAIYLHVPFPSSEIFRCLAVRTEILRAMLCADHIGFLIFEHARHFLTSCKRLLRLNYTTSHNGMLVIEYNGRKINISCSHIEPDMSHLHTILDHVDADKEALDFKKSIEKRIYDSEKKKKFVVTSVDRLEGLTALPLKLRAFDRFLSLHPEKRKSVILIQIGLSMDSRPNDYHQTREYVIKFAAEINRRWAPPREQVVYFEEKLKTTCMERMNLWRLSDVFLDTCVRSGLSLLPFEYVVAQKRNQEHAQDPCRQFGAMVVSEFASYSRILNGCLLINPWKTDDIVNALVKASEMNYYEKHNRFQLNYKFLTMRMESKWSERLLLDIESAVCKKQPIDAGATIDVGFGFDYRVMQFECGFVQLDLDELVKKCTKSSRRLFIFDYGGTLSWTTSILEEEGATRYHRNHSMDSAMSDSFGDSRTAFGQDVVRYIDGQMRTPLSDEARDNIRTLSNDPQNIVFVFSTGRRAELDTEFASISNLNLISDNGFFLKKAGSSHWECLYSDEDLNLDWKDEVKRIMQSFASRTNGAYLIVNEASIIYDYRNCDPEYGEIQSLELYEQLRHVLKKGEATVYRGKGFVEVHQFRVNKSTVMTLILNYMKEKVGVPDFVFFAGDDESDELAIKALQAFAEQEPALEHVFTCTVGMKPSCAKYYVDSVSDILAAVHALAIRLRLESSRPGLFSKKSYFDQFVAQGPLVSPRFIRSLSVETDGTDLSDVMVPPTMPASEALTTPAHQHPSETPLLSAFSALSHGLFSCLEPYVSPEWVALGSAMGAGCIVGAVIGSNVVQRRFKALGHSGREFLLSRRAPIRESATKKPYLPAKWPPSSAARFKKNTPAQRTARFLIAHAFFSYLSIAIAVALCRFVVLVADRYEHTRTHTHLFTVGDMVRTLRGHSPKILLSRDSSGIIRDREYATFCSISLTSEPRGSRSQNEDFAVVQQQQLLRFQRPHVHFLQQTQTQQQRIMKRRLQQKHASSLSSLSDRNRHAGCCSRIPRIPLFIVLAGVLFLLGLAGVVLAICNTVTATFDTDEILFLGALVSCVFSLVVIICYARSRMVRSHPNPLIFSKSLVDLLLAGLYIFQYCATEYASKPVALPFKIAALTQALLVCGEFWFFAIPIDLVQSITNPFTSYAYNFRVYWVYSVLSGTVCGFILWFLDDGVDDRCESDPNKDCRLTSKENQRFFWFHHNTNMPGFFWHRWILYHVWVLVYLVFGVFCISFVQRRLRRGLEETFDVRRRILSNGIFTCATYISWSFAILCLFALTNLAITKHRLATDTFKLLINISAFFHAARGCVNIIVWLVVNAPYLSSLCLRPTKHDRRSSLSKFSGSFSSSDISTSSSSLDSRIRQQEEQELLLLNPQLNTALRKQMIHMATSGIIESVEHFHLMNQRIQSNQTFRLDWERSKQRDLLKMSSSESFVRATKRNSVIQVVEAGRDKTSTPRFSFLPVAMKEMQFYDFQPRVFASIRLLYGIDDAEYMYAFRSTINERISEGRSGAFVFNTCDRKYLVKSMTSEEKSVLLELLPSYLRYLKWNPNTLLPRFFGFHAMKMYGQIFYFVVMGNILSTSETIHRRYDIKGSWVDRNAPACVLGETYRCSKCNRFFKFGSVVGGSDPEAVPCDAMGGSDHYPDITLRDNDLKKRLKLEPETASKLLKQLTRDSNFLASMGIMDYSLLIGTHYSHFKITTKQSSKAQQQQQNDPSSRTRTSMNPPELERETPNPGKVVDAATAEDKEFVHILVDGMEEGEEAEEVLGEHEEIVHQQQQRHQQQQQQQQDRLPRNGGSSTVHGQSHCYRAHQVSGPSAFYFGLVDILQQWTLGKQAERVYKVHVLRKSARGVSAMAPKPYALRFQQKMAQLFSSSQILQAPRQGFAIENQRQQQQSQQQQLLSEEPSRRQVEFQV